jgi:hypothetical protein
MHPHSPQLTLWFTAAAAADDAVCTCHSSLLLLPQQPGDVSRYFTLFGIVCSFISTFFAHGFLTLAKQAIWQVRVRRVVAPRSRVVVHECRTQGGRGSGGLGGGAMSLQQDLLWVANPYNWPTRAK